MLTEKKLYLMYTYFMLLCLIYKTYQERRLQIIYNPPYHEEIVGENNQSKPVYHLFIDNAYKVADVVELITPARFLNKAGATPKAWNEKMLNSNKIKIIYYEEDSSKIFTNVDLKGGVVVTYYNSEADYEPIGVFIHNETLRSIFNKIKKGLNHNIGDLVHSPDSFRFTDEMFVENPSFVGRTDNAHAKAVASSVFDRYPEIFKNVYFENSIKVIGRKNGERISYYTCDKYLNDPGNIFKWKVLIAGAIGTGAFGERLSDPIVAEPASAHTQTFLSMGEFDTDFEAKSLVKFIKTKFLRALLGIMKTTQNNQSKVVWSKIPIQDFTSHSDIDWNKNIKEIDMQLYKKYGLSQEEINFIEKNVKEME